MSLAPSDWYKKLSEDLGPAPAAPPSRQKKRAAKRKRSEVRPDHEESQQQPEPSSESESGSVIESEEPSDTSDFSDSDIGEVQQLTREQVWSTQLLFDSIHEYKFRARVANEYTKLCNALDRPPTNNQKDRFEMQAAHGRHGTQLCLPRKIGCLRLASRAADPLRAHAAANAGQKGKGGGRHRPILVLSHLRKQKDF